MATILCATDFSPPADKAMDIAASLAKAMRARLRLVHILNVLPDLPPDLLSSEVVDSVQAAARSELDRRVAALAARDIDVAGDVQAEQVDEGVIGQAKKLGADLIVIGTHGRRRARRALIGSVAERIIHGAACPVLVVPPAAGAVLAAWSVRDRPLKVVAGIDASPASDAALTWLRGFRRDLPCDLRLIHLYAPPREHQRLGLDPPDPFEADPEAVAVLTREIGAHVTEHLGPEKVALRVRPLWGPQDECLTWEAESDDADLLVVGTAQRWHGSAALATVRCSGVPVICVPARAAGPAQAPQLRPLRTVLVTTDFSPLANSAIAEAYRLLLRGHGTVVLAHVADPGSLGLGLAPERKEEIETCLLALVPKGVDAHAVHTRTLVLESATPGDAIVHAIDRVGADLVVIASHGRSGVSRALHGSVTARVLKASHKPVVVVPAPAAA